MCLSQDGLWILYHHMDLFTTSQGTNQELRKLQNFTTLHGVQTWSSDENSVHPSAYRLSIGTDLDDLERCNSPYFAFSSPNSIPLQADYITVVEDRRIMSVKYCLPVPVFHFWRKL